MKQENKRFFKRIIGVFALILIYLFHIWQQARKLGKICKEKNVVRVAAVGDSITAEHTPRAGYPRYLSKLLGGNYTVKNFGQSGHAVQHLSDMPYNRTTKYKRSLAFRPHIVLLMLGTNDTKARNWKNQQLFKEDYISLTETYLSLDSVSRVILASPPMAYSKPPFKSRINPRVIYAVRDTIKEVAEEYQLEFIDMVSQTKNHPEWLFDGVHPTVEGAKQIAYIFYDVLEE